ncbi:MAG: ribosome silencing factor [Bacteroidia bacterium]|nr:ribosome silencing factor [Bacteroidia bacterium]
MTKLAIDAKSLTDLAIKGLQELKGQKIIRMDLREVDGAITDFFVICTGTSDRHVSSLAESVMKEVREGASDKPISKEGLNAGEWVLLDYVNVVVHVFQQETRDFYRLEALWGDAAIDVIE